MDPATFTSAVLLLCGVALVAHLPPLRKALRVDPVIALRQE
jgi:ABC-type lipoprotein release transport system permease subunit